MASNTETVAAALTNGEKNIVVLGGSYGGVSISHHILKHVIPALPDKDTYQVVMVSASSQAMCRPACPRAIISDHYFDQKKLFVNIPEQFEQYAAGSFRFVHGIATALDHTSRNVTIKISGGSSETETLHFYALVIATGAQTKSPLFSFRGSEQDLHNDWNTFRTALSSAKSIVIAGGGPTGVETAGELGEHLNGRAGFFSSQLANPKVTITVVNSGTKILPILRPSIANSAEALLAKVGVTVINNKKVTSVSPEGAGVDIDHLTSKATVTLDDNTTLQADLYIPAIGTRPNTQFVDASLLTSDGRIDTNAATLRVDKAGAGSRIYAVGDVASYARAAVHLILDAIPVLSANIKRDLLLASSSSSISSSGNDDTKKTPPGADREYKEDKRETQLVPIGKSKAVGAVMGYQLPGFLVWAIKGRDYWLWTTGPLWSGKQWAKAA